MASTKDKVTDIKPYVERALKDDELRDALVTAFAAARQVYDDLLGNRGATGLMSRVATDEDVQDNLKKAIDELRHAANRVQGKDEHTGRNSMLLLAGITLGVLFNPVTGKQTRDWVKERILGPSDEFDFGSGDGDTGTTGGGQAA
jgi:hypothetical protein